MELQYYTSLWSDTKEMRHLVDHAREVQPNKYDSTTQDGRQAVLIVDDHCAYVYY